MVHTHFHQDLLISTEIALPKDVASWQHTSYEHSTWYMNFITLHKTAYICTFNLFGGELVVQMTEQVCLHLLIVVTVVASVLNIQMNPSPSIRR